MLSSVSVDTQFSAAVDLARILLEARVNGAPVDLRLDFFAAADLLLPLPDDGDNSSGLRLADRPRDVDRDLGLDSEGVRRRPITTLSFRL
jgi:hypothetical protein